MTLTDPEGHSATTYLPKSKFMKTSHAPFARSSSSLLSLVPPNYFTNGKRQINRDRIITQLTSDNMSRQHIRRHHTLPVGSRKHKHPLVASVMRH